MGDDGSSRYGSSFLSRVVSYQEVLRSCAVREVDSSGRCVFGGDGVSCRCSCPLYHSLSGAVLTPAEESFRRYGGVPRRGHAKSEVDSVLESLAHQSLSYEHDDSCVVRDGSSLRVLPSVSVEFHSRPYHHRGVSKRRKRAMKRAFARQRDLERQRYALAHAGNY